MTCRCGFDSWMSEKLTNARMWLLCFLLDGEDVEQKKEAIYPEVGKFLC